MSQFHKKPVVIDAMQYDGTNGEEVAAWCGGWRDTLGGPVIRIGTLEGDMAARVGDWVIRGVKGEFYPCKPDIFAATYESVDGASSPPEPGRGPGVFSISAASWDALRGAIEGLIRALPDTVVTDLPAVRVLDDTLTAIVEAEAGGAAAGAPSALEDIAQRIAELSAGELFTIARGAQQSGYPMMQWPSTLRRALTEALCGASFPSPPSEEPQQEGP